MKTIQREGQLNEEWKQEKEWLRESSVPETFVSLWLHTQGYAFSGDNYSEGSG